MCALVRCVAWANTNSCFHGYVHCRYSTKVDVWAAGLICYLLLSGTMPFSRYVTNFLLEADLATEPYLFIRKSQANLYASVTTDRLFPSNYWANIPEDAKDFIRKLLQPNPQQRASSSEMIQHSWLNVSMHTHTLHTHACMYTPAHTHTHTKDRPRSGREEKSRQLLEHIYTKAADRIAPVLILSVSTSHDCHIRSHVKLFWSCDLQVTALDHQPKSREPKTSTSNSH